MVSNWAQTRYQLGMKYWFVLLLTLLGMGVVFGLVGGGLGAVHPVGDSLAVFRAYLTGLALVIAGLLWGLGAGRMAVIIGGVGALAGVTLAIAFWPVASNEGAFRLYQKNMLFRNADPVALADDIVARVPDFVTLQEVSGANLGVLDVLRPEFPAQNMCEWGSVGGVAVASRWPMIAGSAFCSDAGGLGGMQVDTPEGPVWVVSVHLHWPWPLQQEQHVAKMIPDLQALTGKVVLGGDFNMVPWSFRLDQIEGATGTERLGPAFTTLIKANRGLRVVIDHVLVTGGRGRVTQLPRLGSDHFGLLARFAL